MATAGAELTSAIIGGVTVQAHGPACRHQLDAASCTNQMPRLIYRTGPQPHRRPWLPPWSHWRLLRAIAIIDGPDTDD